MFKKIVIPKIEKKDLPENEYLNPTQISKLLGISICTVYRSLKKGTIPSFRIGRGFFVKKDVFESLFK